MMTIEDRAKMTRLKMQAIAGINKPFAWDGQAENALHSNLEGFYEREILGHDLKDGDIVLLLMDAGKKFVRGYKAER